ncbi:MAG: hypothetical protein HY922_12840 [Elusimicrobia bacterium]|nr:hypothetical protein [Elusimicrobiota bacterium]
MLILAALLTFCAPSPSASAQAEEGSQGQEAPALTVDVEAHKEVRVRKGEGSAVEKAPPEEAKRGDIIVYTVRYLNDQDSDLEYADIILPVPPGTTFVFASAKVAGTEVTYSTDNGESFQRPPLKLRLKNSDGSKVVKLATAAMITHIRWAFRKAVPPGGKGEFRFKVRVK